MSTDRYSRLPSFKPLRMGWPWRLAGLWMVVLAVGLAIIGIVFSFQQAHAVTQRLMSQSEAVAHLVADRAEQDFDGAMEKTLLFGLRAMSPGDASIPVPRPPAWIESVFYVRGGKSYAVPPYDAPAAATLLAGPFHARFTGQALTTLVTDANRRPEIMHEVVDGLPSVIAGWYVKPAGVNAAVLVAVVHADRLRSALIEPLIPVDSGLELIADGQGRGAWSHRLPGAMRHWCLQPTDAFTREQRRSILGQTATSLGVTVLGLLTILGAMAVLVRLVRREVALAEMKANFVADVSHELKTPLALIRMFAETLAEDRVPTEEKRREYYAIMVRESTRLTNLINNILDFARIDAGRREYRLEPADVGHVVRDTYEAYRGHLDLHGFEHHLSIESSLPTVEADRDAIAQALINLINNAVKYSAEERYLAIDVTTDTRRGRYGVLISVHDRGIGIKPEERARIFEGFFRSPDGRVREQSGTGLGLSLVKHIVESHGGILDVESRLVKGTTFRLFLPGIDHTERMSAGRGRPHGPA